ncbi:uncharacterized protein METZ01_LOCUS364725, partial [marine metagenome]
MKLLDHINRSIWLNEGDERSEIAANMHDYLKGWLTSEEPQYPTIEEMFQDLYAKLEDVSHDDIGSSSEHRNFMSNPVGLNFDNKGGVVDAVLSDVDLQNYLPTFNEGSNDGYYLEKDAMKLWLDDNPGKTERDWKYIGVDVQDEYTEKAGGEKGKYLGKGASEWTRTDRFGSDSTWTRTKESEEPLIPKIVSSDGQLVANDWDSAIELAQQLNIDAEELDYIEREGDSSSLLDFLHGHGYSIME